MSSRQPQADASPPRANAARAPAPRICEPATRSPVPVRVPARRPAARGWGGSGPDDHHDSCRFRDHRPARRTVDIRADEIAPGRRRRERARHAERRRRSPGSAARRRARPRSPPPGPDWPRTGGRTARRPRACSSSRPGRSLVIVIGLPAFGLADGVSLSDPWVTLADVVAPGLGSVPAVTSQATQPTSTAPTTRADLRDSAGAGCLAPSCPWPDHSHCCPPVGRTTPGSHAASADPEDDCGRRNHRRISSIRPVYRTRFLLDLLARPRTYRYGDHSAQRADLHLPRRPGSSSRRRRDPRRVVGRRLREDHHAPDLVRPRPPRVGRLERRIPPDRPRPGRRMAHDLRGRRRRDRPPPGSRRSDRHRPRRRSRPFGRWTARPLGRRSSQASRRRPRRRPGGDVESSRLPGRRQRPWRRVCPSPGRRRRNADGGIARRPPRPLCDRRPDPRRAPGHSRPPRPRDRRPDRLRSPQSRLRRRRPCARRLESTSSRFPGRPASTASTSTPPGSPGRSSLPGSPATSVAPVPPLAAPAPAPPAPAPA